MSEYHDDLLMEGVEYVARKVERLTRERDALHKALRDVRSALGTETVEDATVDFLAKTHADVRVMLDHARFERDEARAELEIMRAKKCRLMEERGKAEAERDEARAMLAALLPTGHLAAVCYGNAVAGCIEPCAKVRAFLGVGK